MTHVVDIHHIIAVGLDSYNVAIRVDVAEVITISVTKPGKQLQNLIGTASAQYGYQQWVGPRRAIEGWRTSITLITPSGTPRAGPEISAWQMRAMSTSCRTRVELPASTNGATLAKPSATASLAIGPHIHSVHYSPPLCSLPSVSQAVHYLRESKPFAKSCALAAPCLSCSLRASSSALPPLPLPIGAPHEQLSGRGGSSPGRRPHCAASPHSQTPPSSPSDINNGSERRNGATLPVGTKR